MSERERIAERLQRKEQEIKALEERVKAGRVYAQALRDVLQLIDNATRASVSTESALRSGSSVARARDVILKRGKPVHVSDLLKAIDKEPTRESRASLTSSLAAYVRRGEIFTRPAPNTYGLAELGHDSNEVELIEPPTGFGKITPPPPPPIKSEHEEVDDTIAF